VQHSNFEEGRFLKQYAWRYSPQSLFRRT